MSGADHRSHGCRVLIPAASITAGSGRDRVDDVRRTCAEQSRTIGGAGEDARHHRRTRPQSRDDVGSDVPRDCDHLHGVDLYTFALVPTQPDPTGAIVFDPARVEGQGSLAARTARASSTRGT